MNKSAPFEASDASALANMHQIAKAATPRNHNDPLLTATLESSLHHLDSLRREIEKASRKDILDVRDMGGIGADLLAAYENTIDYYDLVDLINEMRDGIAKRRAAALGVLA